MKKKESKGTNHALKNISGKPSVQDIAGKMQMKKKRAKGSGGARKGSGRPALDHEVKRTEVKMPLTLYNDLMDLEIPNLTAYIIALVEKDVSRQKKIKGY